MNGMDNGTDATAPKAQAGPKRCKATIQRHRRMAELRELRAENELLHRRLAAVYEALSLK